MVEFSRDDTDSVSPSKAQGVESDSFEFGDLIKGIVCLIALKSVMSQLGLNSIAAGGCSVLMAQDGALQIMFSNQVVFIDSTNRIEPSTVDRQQLFEVFERLRVAAISYREPPNPQDPSKVA